MRFPSFAPLFLAIKAKGASAVLGWGYGLTFIVSLLFSVLLGILAVWLYEVPVSKTQIHVNKLEGGNEECYSHLYFFYNYGMGLNEKWRTDYKASSWFNLYAITDSGVERNVDSISNAHVVNEKLRKQIADKYKNEVIKNNFSPIYIMREKMSCPPRTLYVYLLPDDFYFEDTYKIDGENENKTICPFENSSVLTISSKENRDGILVEEIESDIIIGLNEKGNAAEFCLPQLTYMFNPRWYSVFDISQSYFIYDIDIPTTTKHDSKIVIDFGSAAVFSEMSPQPDSTTMTSIVFYDSSKIETIKRNGFWMHAKFVQLENLQILRMFILTTLWGFFVALTFSSLWKFLKIRSRRYRINKYKEKTSTIDGNA